LLNARLGNIAEAFVVLGGLSRTKNGVQLSGHPRLLLP
jgi:hypothetical protein